MLISRAQFLDSSLKNQFDAQMLFRNGQLQTVSEGIVDSGLRIEKNDGIRIYRQNAHNKVRLGLIYIYDGEGSTGEDQSANLYPDQLVELKKSEGLTIVELHLVFGRNGLKINNRTRLSLDGDSSVEYIQCWNLGESNQMVNRVEAKVDKDSRLHFYQMHLSSAQTMNDLTFDLLGVGAGVEQRALVRTRGKARVNTQSRIIHHVGSTSSDQVCKNILTDQSQVLFTGVLKIEKGAQKSDARQYCHNLLLHPDAEASARPQLEVLADDVKAAHGATMGGLSKEQIFYLQSRAIDRVAAEKTLADGFQNQILSHVTDCGVQEFLKSLMVESEMGHV